MSSADAPSTTTSSWTWPNSICVSRASSARTLDRAYRRTSPSQSSPNCRDRADQQHVADVEHADQPADRDTEFARGIEDDPPDAGDAGQEGGHEAALVGDRRLDGAGGVDQRAHARHRLEAALPPAAARSVGAAHRDVAELACAIAIALEQLAIEDDPGADPATHLDHDQVVGPRAAKEGQLGEGGSVTVVGDHDRHAVALLEQRPEAELSPVQVDRPADGPRARVDDAGRADADAEEGRPVIGAQGVDKLEDELDGGIAVPSFEGQVDRAEDLATQVDDGTAELRLAEVEPDQVATVGSDAQQDG